MPYKDKDKRNANLKKWREKMREHLRAYHREWDKINEYSKKLRKNPIVFKKMEVADKFKDTPYSLEKLNANFVKLKIVKKLDRDITTIMISL